MSSANDLPRVDWAESSPKRVSATTVLVLVGLLAIAAAYAYVSLTPVTAVLGYVLSPLDWLWVGSLWMLLAIVATAAVTNPKRTAVTLDRLRRNPVTLLAFLATLGVFLAGTLGPVVLSGPTIHIPYRNQPPVFTSVPLENVVRCYNPVGDRCYGSWRYPLGTNRLGIGMGPLLVFGARNVVRIALVAVMLIVPLATLVGTVSAYTGGRVDRVLTGVAESLKAIPALLVFFVWRWMTGDGTPFMLVVAFGLVNWGSVAVVVRSRALDEVAKDYVRAARASGASSTQIVRWHLIPNVTRSAMVAAIAQIPLFITIEATLAFLMFGSPPSPLLLTPTDLKLWGELIGQNVDAFVPYWWRLVLPVAALCFTILSVSVLADGIQRLFDPRRSK